MIEKVDIAIVGAGLVGASLAAAIASEPENKALSIALIDQGAAPSVPDLGVSPPEFDPRVVALTNNSIELLNHIGAWSSIADSRACFYRNMTVWDDEGTGEIRFDANELERESLGVIVENSILLNGILKTLDNHNNVRLIRGQTVESSQLEGPFRELILPNGDTIQATLVMAADGGASRVRELLAMDTRTWRYHQKAIVATVKSEDSHQFTAWQNFLQTGPLAFLPLGDESERYCSIVWSADDERADQLMALSDLDFEQLLGRSFEYRTGNVSLAGKRYCFPLIQRHAIDYIVPQLALVGDAARTIHPLAGQGVNLGLLDAKVLAQEVSYASRRGLSVKDDSILRRYQRQRKRHNLEIMLLMESFKRMFGSRNMMVRWLRNHGMKTFNNSTRIKNWLAKQAMGGH